MTSPSHARSSRRATGLRRKVGVLLLGSSVIVLFLAGTLGLRVVDDLVTDLSQELAITEAQLTREKIQALVGRELAISQRFAELTALREWLADEQNPHLRERFMNEAERFRHAFADKSYFIIHQHSLAYYYADRVTGHDAHHRYTLSPDNQDDVWYFATVAKPEAYSLNVNPDAKLKVTNLWINIQVRGQNGAILGLAGTGLELDRFLASMLIPRTDGSLMSFIVDGHGCIVAHPDRSQIEYGALAKQNTAKTVFARMAGTREQDMVATALSQAQTSPGSVETLDISTLDGRRIMAFAHIPQLNWTVVSSVTPSTTTALSSNFVHLILFGGGTVLLVLIGAVTIGFDRIVLHPLHDLTESALQIASGRYDIRLHSSRKDEIGELSLAFDSMAAQVQAHTDELEQRVAERTAELEATHATLATTHSQLTESIRYASLIQRVILPDRQLATRMHGQYFVVWQPRDVVGGDFYLYREHAGGCLFGVIDCAGHGVPGAFMTMIAHAALERAMIDTDWRDTSALLARADAAVRQMLPNTDRLERLATSMDIGLCHVDWKTRQVRFSGAHIDLFVASEGTIRHFKGERSGINDRKSGSFATHGMDLPAEGTFYLITDGILDQSGGEKGLPFGRTGFTAWLEKQCHEPLRVQEAALVSALRAYQGTYPQRDDITVLAFRFDTSDGLPTTEEHP